MIYNSNKTHTIWAYIEFLKHNLTAPVLTQLHFHFKKQWVGEGGSSHGFSGSTFTKASSTFIHSKSLWEAIATDLEEAHFKHQNVMAHAQKIWAPRVRHSKHWPREHRRNTSYNIPYQRAKGTVYVICTTICLSQPKSNMVTKIFMTWYSKYTEVTTYKKSQQPWERNEVSLGLCLRAV